MVLKENKSYSSLSTGSLFLLLLVHIPLGLLLQRFSAFATIHAILTLVFGLYYAMSGKLEKVAYMSAYIVGSEVLWRMTDASVFHEFGKYEISLLFFVSLVLNQKKINIPGTAFLYFVLMLPSIILVMDAYSPSLARELISFNLSGPLALMMSVWFFSKCQLTKRQLATILYLIIPPIVSCATIALYLIESTSVSYNIHSAWARSGDYAPNQVSTILGLGVFSAYLVLFIFEDLPKSLRIVLLGVVVWLAAQSSLTFSRSGVFGAVISAFAASVFLISNRRGIGVLLFTVIPLILLSSFIVIPKLIDLTGGSIIARFSSFETTGRDLILRGDLILWEQNFWFGVGPGVSSQIRPWTPYVAAHTEFTRLLADHGILGLFSNILFLAMIFKAWFGANLGWKKGLVVGFAVWTISFMLGTATRIVAPSFMFGLAFALSNLVESNAPVPAMQTNIGTVLVRRRIS